jgi:hypothetical protein
VSAPRQRQWRLCLFFLALGVLLIVCGFVYYIRPADALPSWFPGHTPGEQTVLLTTALFSALAGVACVIVAGVLTPRKADPVRELDERLRVQARSIHEQRVAARWDQIDRARRGRPTP